MGPADGQRRVGLVRPEQVGERMSPKTIYIAMPQHGKEAIRNYRAGTIVCDTNQRRLKKTLHKLGWTRKNYYLIEYAWSFFDVKDVT